MKNSGCLRTAARSYNAAIVRNVTTKIKAPELRRNTSPGDKKKVSPFGYLLLVRIITNK